jgi:hypothetical protein
MNVLHEKQWITPTNVYILHNNQWVIPSQIHLKTSSGWDNVTPVPPPTPEFFIELDCRVGSAWQVTSPLGSSYPNSRRYVYDRTIGNIFVYTLQTWEWAYGAYEFGFGLGREFTLLGPNYNIEYDYRLKQWQDATIADTGSDLPHYVHTSPTTNVVTLFDVNQLTTPSTYSIVASFDNPYA